MHTNANISKIAARWFIRMRDAAPDAPERTEFEAWLMQNPQHQHEYASIGEAWSGIDSVAELKAWLAARQSTQFFKQVQRSQKIKKNISMVAVFMTIGLASLLGAQQYQVWQASPTMQMASQSNTAQIVTQTLEDGSQVTLNAASKIQVTFYQNRRHIELQQGEAIFNVQKDENRPFIVEANRVKITVLGTRFAVNKLNKLVRVSVDHGKVQVESGTEKQILQNGEVAEVLANQGITRKSANADDYFKFAKGIVVFNQAGIDEIAEVLSRYRANGVVTSGVPQEKISAIFEAKDTETFIQTLPKIANVSVETIADKKIIRAK